MSIAPSYLKRLNGIAVAEGRNHRYFSAWVDVTPDEELRAVLRKVATREADHSMSFAKRVDELGFVLEPSDDPNFARQMEIASSRSLTDLEKMDQLGYRAYFEQADEGPDLFDSYFADHSIDPQTGMLFGSFIAEERDTIRLLRASYDRLRRNATQPAQTQP